MDGLVEFRFKKSISKYLFSTYVEESSRNWEFYRERKW